MGSDLNHPIVPLLMIGTEIAKNMDASMPAVVPPMTRTMANIAIEVSAPNINGNGIMKSYNVMLPPNIL